MFLKVGLALGLLVGIPTQAAVKKAVVIDAPTPAVCVSAVMESAGAIPSITVSPSADVLRVAEEALQALASYEAPASTDDVRWVGLEMGGAVTAFNTSPDRRISRYAEQMGFEGHVYIANSERADVAKALTELRDGLPSGRTFAMRVYRGDPEIRAFLTDLSTRIARPGSSSPTDLNVSGPARDEQVSRVNKWSTAIGAVVGFVSGAVLASLQFTPHSVALPAEVVPESASHWPEILMYMGGGTVVGGALGLTAGRVIDSVRGVYGRVWDTIFGTGASVDPMVQFEDRIAQISAASAAAELGPTDPSQMVYVCARNSTDQRADLLFMHTPTAGRILAVRVWEPGS